MQSLFGDEVPAEIVKDERDSRPLAARMRPQSFEDFVGQQELIGPGRPLRLAVERDDVPSMVLWGPPGTGKTTLAQLIAQRTRAHFVALSAVSAGVADLRRVIGDATALRRSGRRTVVFIDEIHRFNRGQQDAVLPYVEDGTITLIGATTENPSFEVNGALLSRSRVFVLEALADLDIRRIVLRALREIAASVGAEVLLDDAALALLANLANGDARTALNTLEFAANATPTVDGVRTITPAVVTDAAARRATSYDKTGESHYDTVSAFIKSIRGSDPDAAVYWLARMIEHGEDPLFIARRLVILASEDVGLCDAQALPLAVAAQQAVHFVGMPEGFYALSHATLYLATAPKGNAVGRAYAAAMDDVRATRNDPVPLHLRNAPTSLMRGLGYSTGYRYAHDEPAAALRSDHPPTEEPHPYRPENVAGHRYLEPGRQGHEEHLRLWVEQRYAGEKPT